MATSGRFRAGVCILALLVGAALFAPWIAPQDPLRQNLENDLLFFSAGHPLGTDKLGRDVLSRAIYASRISLAVGVITVMLSVTVGFGVGALSGYVGGWTDQLVMRVVDVLLAFPGVLLAIALTAALGPGLHHVILALCLIGWTGYARLVRAEILSLRGREFIQAAQALGSGPARILGRHLLPNLLPPLLVQAAFGLAGAILAEGALSFLGLGVEPPTPSWGAMLNEGRQFILVAPHLTTYPGLAIMLAVLAFNLVGESLQQRLGRD